MASLYGSRGEAPARRSKGRTLPRVISLGGDYTITLPVLRFISRAYGPVSVIRFDSHLDTYTQPRPPQYADTQDSPLPPIARRTGRPKAFGGSPSEATSINHATYFYHAAREGLLANDSTVHAGIRTTLSGPSDLEHDRYCGFKTRLSICWSRRCCIGVVLDERNILDS
ncbi:hypothetical protein DL767_002896 [Monosporascus sp. MG133]|nr:hypothetical protein DL767_002896 [Monosporascus sp. MG133]